MVYRDSPYHDSVQAHFGPHADHPFVRWLDSEMRTDLFNYFRHKMSGYSFEFDAREIVRSPVYNSTNFKGQGNTLLPAVEQMQAFADATGFRSFFADHRDLYDQQVSFFRDSVDTGRMLAWLEREFPGRSAYDHIKVVFSPLVYANQSVTWFETDGFSELQPHINFPYPPSTPGSYSAASVALTRGDLLFTEVNHGFINPTADSYAAEIERALADRQGWAREGTASASYYGSPLSLFNEMMNWGLVELYYVDYAPVQDLDRLLEKNRTFMQDRRGFESYPDFAGYLVEQYRTRESGATVADLYPRLINWVAERARTPRNP